MHIDITKLQNRIVNEINLDTDLLFPNELLENSRIKDLKEVHFIGKITFDYEEELVLQGSLKGTMFLEDDLTLELIERPFQIEIDENMQKYNQNNQNTLDIIEVLWQNIVVEVPIRVTNSEIKDIKIQGQGWKVINEDEFKRKNNLSLGELLEDVRKE